MTVSPASSVGRAAAFLLAAVLPFAAMAQPVQLRPPTTSEPAKPVQADAVSGPSSGDAEEKPNRSDAADTDSVPQPQPGKTKIVVNPLEAVAPGAFGLIGPAEGGFAPDLWQGAKWPFVKKMMPRIPGATAPGAIRRLSVQLLTSRARIPEGKPADDSFIELRVDRLIELGESSSALALLGVVPVDVRSESLLRTATELLFFQNSNAEACAQARAVSERSSGRYWNQARAFCLALEGKHASAALISELLREHEEDIDPAFFDAIEALGGVKGIEIKSVSKPSGLLLSMMRIANLRLPSALVQTESPIVLRWIARAPNAAIDDRLLAAEKSLLAGSMSAEEIFSIYNSTPVSGEALQNPILWAQTNWGPRGRALLTRVAASQNTPLAIAEVLRRALSLAEDKDNFTEFAFAVSPIVGKMTPGPELVWFAEDAARILFRTGNLAQALTWYDLVAGNVEDIEEATSIETSLWALAVLAGSRSAKEELPGRLMTWLTNRLESGGDEAVSGSLLFLSLAEASGLKAPPEAWRQLVDRPTPKPEPSPGDAWRRLLEDSAANGRVGEAVLLTVVGAANEISGNYRGTSAAAAVAALRAVGRESDADYLALTSALAAKL